MSNVASKDSKNAGLTDENAGLIDKNVKTFKSIVETPSSEEAQKDLSDYMNSPSIETTLGKAGELIVTAGKFDYGIDDDILAEVNEVVSYGGGRGSNVQIDLKALFAGIEKKDYSATVKGLATSINDYIKTQPSKNRHRSILPILVKALKGLDVSLYTLSQTYEVSEGTMKSWIAWLNKAIKDYKAGKPVTR